jgi:hypothetical protein
MDQEFWEATGEAEAQWWINHTSTSVLPQAIRTFLPLLMAYTEAHELYRGYSETSKTKAKAAYERGFDKVALAHS